MESNSTNNNEGKSILDNQANEPTVKDSLNNIQTNSAENNMEHSNANNINMNNQNTLKDNKNDEDTPTENDSLNNVRNGDDDNYKKFSDSNNFNNPGVVNASKDQSTSDEGHDSEYTTESESDIDDNDEHEDPDIKFQDQIHHATVLWLERLKSRTTVPELPHTVTKLVTPEGSSVYLVGTAHFSTESQEDVAKTIQAVKPDIIVLELCKSRLSILQLCEKTILEESKNLNFSKMRSTIQQSGLVQGIMYIMLLSMSANVTKSLGMAPGGEFRRAVQESSSVPGCVIHLGDRPIQVTIQRALSSLTWCQSFRLMWQLLFNQDSVTVEDVEKCKQRDLLEEMLVEMTGEYPALSQVFVNERDIYLTHSLQQAAAPTMYSYENSDMIPSVVVGVVGIGHVPGIVKSWNTISDEDIAPIMMLPKKSRVGRILKVTLRCSMIGLIIWSIYKVTPRTIKDYFPPLHSIIPSSETFRKLNFF